MISLLHLILLFVAVQRVLELIYANKNTRLLLKQGGIEYGAKHYPLFLILHSCWLLSIFLLVAPNSKTNYFLLLIFFITQLGRLWVIISLGKFWTTRIITTPDQPLVHSGPYRWLKHPNYLIVSVEIAILPLTFGSWTIAIFFTIANALLLLWRIRVENLALISKRASI